MRSRATVNGATNTGGVFVGLNNTVTLERVQVMDNANGLLGDGILIVDGATLLLKQSRITANSLDIEGQGGGIDNQGTTTLDASRVSGNVVPDGTGGGAYNVEKVRLNLTNGSEVIGNSAEREDGAGNQGLLTVSGGSTITGSTGDCENFGSRAGCPV